MSHSAAGKEHERVGAVAASTGEPDEPATVTARRAYLRSVAEGQPLTGNELGRMCGRSSSWGRSQIRAAKAELAAADQSATAEQEHAEALAEHPPATRNAEDGNDSPQKAADAAAAAAADPTPTGTADPVRAEQRPGASLSAVIGLAAGVVMSVAANIAHSFLPPAGAPAGWHPPVGAVLAAAWWPVALFLAVEVLTRVRWQSGPWWATARYGGVTIVATVAAIVSYRHMAGLLIAYGEDPISAHIGPLAVDGLMVVAGLALLTIGARPTPKESAPAERR
ncbi:DUF2637 domain-containing protein [Fodinicola acaciae]|uniref:DUF2637 domain-containing protein n=1 Tax=Fodinicola acaciae TaxID=2681555 RepID=UPI0013D6660C|nr:DUF2637 domain-containing protein [Fodinicola acaciae]